ncbi:MAG TPA: hypothetical protein VHK91_15515, partial [Flavisolibacter sp.]|nr:hypothetical protein [Flavisolibacter sp.]
LKEVDFDKLNKELSTSIEKIHIDQDKMKADLEKALKDIDMEKISKDVQASLKEVDAARIQADVQGALSKVDWDKIQAEIKRTSQVELPKVKAELERIKDIDLREVEANLKKIQPELEQSLKSTRESLEKMKVELKAYQTFIDRLETDGRIDKKVDYTIQYKAGSLLINGKKQTDEVTTSYQWFLKDRKDFTIRKEADGFNIDKD